MPPVARRAQARPSGETKLRAQCWEHLSCVPGMPSFLDLTDRVVVGLTEALLFPRQLPLLLVVVVLAHHEVQVPWACRG